MATIPYQPSFQTNRYEPHWSFNQNPITRSPSVPTPQHYQLLAAICKNQMNEIINMIEYEKMKFPPNLYLIQTYIDLHWQRIYEFERYIPHLPILNARVLTLSASISDPLPAQNTQAATMSFNEYTFIHSALKPFDTPQNTSLSITKPTELEILPSNESKSSNNSDIIDISENDPNTVIQREDSHSILHRVYSKQSLSNITPTPTTHTISISTSKSDSPLVQSSDTLLPIHDNGDICDAIRDDTDTYIDGHSLKCKSIQECTSILNIIKSLVFYQEYQKENKEELKEFFSKRYTNLINDYHHILQKHLDKDSASNNKEFEAIYLEIRKYIGCDVHKCAKYLRNERNREKDDYNQYNDTALTAIMDMLDTIHCYFLHSFDTGYRVDNKHHKLLYIVQNTEDIEDIHWDDLEMKQLKQYLHNKRKHLCHISGLNRRIKHYKFCTTDNEHRQRHTQSYKSNDEDSRCSLQSFVDTESIASLASIASIASTVNSYSSSTSLSEALRPNMDTYSFGHRFYYWHYYKDKKGKDPWNCGYMFRDWYIDHKHSNLKEEILYNGIYTLDSKRFQAAQRKAYIIWKSYAIKSRECDTHHFEHLYNIYKNDGISMEHILSLVLYTDYDGFCYEFSKTFRKRYCSETYQSLKRRNSEFANCARLLRESIECFGEKMKHTQIKVFYHGVSRHLLNALVCRFGGPCSTTPQLEVATLFTKQEGIILELEKYSDNLRYFNCALLSCYGNEDERLFIGGYHYLNIHSVREMQCGSPVNYFHFIRALCIFNQAIEGKRHLRIETVRKKDYDIIHKLIKHQLASMSVIEGIDDMDNNTNAIYCNKFPDYINSCFNRLVQSKKMITINLYWLRRAYPGFQREFIDDEGPNLAIVRLDILCAIFYGCSKVTVNMDQCDTDRALTVPYLTHLCRVLKRLNQIYHSRIRQICIKGTKQLFSKQELIQQKFIFNGIDWKLDIQHIARKNQSNLLLTRNKKGSLLRLCE